MQCNADCEWWTRHYTVWLFHFRGHQQPNESTIFQKCLKQFPPSFGSLSGKFGAALKTIYLFQMIRGTLVYVLWSRRKFQTVFSSYTVSYPHGFRAILSFARGAFCLYTRLFRRPFLTIITISYLVIKCEKHNLQKSQVKLVVREERLFKF